MKYKRIAILKKALATASFLSAYTYFLAPLPSNAQDNGYYYCETSGKYPATVRLSGNEEFVFLSWQSNYGMASGYSQSRRCQIVTDKLNRNLKNGNLNYFVPGKAGNDAAAPGLPVVCASPVKTSLATCPSTRILWTVSSEKDINKVLAQIVKFNDSKYNDPIRLANPLEKYQGYNNVNIQILNQNLRPFDRSSHTPHSSTSNKDKTGDCVRTRLGTCL